MSITELSLESEARRSAVDVSSSPMVAVEFVVPATMGAGYAELIAEFVHWVPLPMDRQPDGSHTVTVWLEAGRSWRYQFLIDEVHVVNDWDASQYDVGEFCCFAVVDT